MPDPLRNLTAIGEGKRQPSGPGNYSGCVPNLGTVSPNLGTAMYLVRIARFRSILAKQINR